MPFLVGQMQNCKIYLTKDPTTTIIREIIQSVGIVCLDSTAKVNEVYSLVVTYGNSWRLLVKAPLIL